MPKIQSDSSEQTPRPKRRSSRAVPKMGTPVDTPAQAEGEDDGIDSAPAQVPPALESPGPGRPTKYDPSYCEMLHKHMRTGLSFESFAGAVGVNQDTLYEWAKRHPEFSEAKKRAFSANLLFWEQLGVRGAMGTLKGFNVGAWIFNMKNRHRWNDGQTESEENPMEKVLEQFRQANDALLKKLPQN